MILAQARSEYTCAWLAGYKLLKLPREAGWSCSPIQPRLKYQAGEQVFRVLYATSGTAGKLLITYNVQI